MKNLKELLIVVALAALALAALSSELRRSHEVYDNGLPEFLCGVKRPDSMADWWNDLCDPGPKPPTSDG